MADGSVRISNFPDSGSAERVAFDLMKWLQNTVEKEGKNKQQLRDEHLTLYAECLHVARGGKPPAR